MRCKPALIAVILGASAAPLAAQDLSFNQDITAAFLLHTPDLAGQMACIGASANACMENTPGGYSTAAMSGCLDRELQYWDARLNANYTQARAKARTADSYVDGTPSETALRDMQRAWITFRDATCDYERSHWGGGTGGGPATYSCLMRMTGQQALYLANSGIGE